LDLSKKSGCITITVREFLNRFSHTGLIQKKPREKWQMVEFDEAFARELIDFRSLLEMNSITHLLEQGDDHPIWAELQQLLLDHKELQPHMETRFREFSKLDERLHLAIQSSTDNRFTKQFFNTVSFVCHYHYQWGQHDEKERNSIALAQHIDLLNKLLSRDIRGSILSLETHLNTARTTLLRSSQNLQ
jgi:DNA-binding GntR family transcriptional regulator